MAVLGRYPLVIALALSAARKRATPSQVFGGRKSASA